MIVVEAHHFDVVLFKRDELNEKRLIIEIRPLSDIRRIAILAILAILAHHPDHGATTHIITP